jgi:hypothetical protein
MTVSVTGVFRGFRIPAISRKAYRMTGKRTVHARAPRNMAAACSLFIREKMKVNIYIPARRTAARRARIRFSLSILFIPLSILFSAFQTADLQISIVNRTTELAQGGSL